MPNDFGLTKAQYTISETGAILSLGRSSVYALINSGELPPVRYGHKTVIAALDIARIIEMRRGSNLPMPRNVTQAAEPSAPRRLGRPPKITTRERGTV